LTRHSHCRAGSLGHKTHTLVWFSFLARACVSRRHHEIRRVFEPKTKSLLPMAERRGDDRRLKKNQTGGATCIARLRSIRRLRHEKTATSPRRFPESVSRYRIDHGRPVGEHGSGSLSRGGSAKKTRTSRRDDAHEPGSDSGCFFFMDRIHDKGRHAAAALQLGGPGPAA